MKVRSALAVYPALALVLMLGACSSDGATPVAPIDTAEAIVGPITDPAEDRPEAPDYPDLPDVDPASGPEATSGEVTLHAPEGFIKGDYGDEFVTFFDGPAIEESASPKDGAVSYAAMQVFVPVDDSAWDGTLDSAGWEGATENTYNVPIEGADVATLRFTQRTQGHDATSLEGDTYWEGPIGLGELRVKANGVVTTIIIYTNPTPAGLDLAASVARSVIITK